MNDYIDLTNDSNAVKCKWGIYLARDHEYGEKLGNNTHRNLTKTTWNNHRRHFQNNTTGTSEFLSSIVGRKLC
jgi:hypothetical protein